MTQIQVRVNKDLKLIPYAEHWHTAISLLDRSKSEKKGSYHQHLACITFVAFTLEAFLNHIGEEQFCSWVDLEQLNVRGKINVIAEKLKINIDYGSMPWQIVPDLVAFRNKVAHGKNERLFEEVVLPQDKYDEHLNTFLKSDWQKTATQAGAEKFIKHVEALCIKIWEAAGHDKSTIFTTGIQSGKASLEP